MTNIAAVLFPEAALPSEPAPAEPGAVEGLGFAELLASAGGAAPVAPSPLAEDVAGAGDAGAVEDAGEGDEEATSEDADAVETSEPAPKEDLAVLNSFLALWQILPPQPPALAGPSASADDSDVADEATGESSPISQTSPAPTPGGGAEVPRTTNATSAHGGAEATATPFPAPSREAAGSKPASGDGVVDSSGLEAAAKQAGTPIRAEVGRDVQPQEVEDAAPLQPETVNLLRRAAVPPAQVSSVLTPDKFPDDLGAGQLSSTPDARSGGSANGEVPRIEVLPLDGPVSSPAGDRPLVETVASAVAVVTSSASPNLPRTKKVGSAAEPLEIRPSQAMPTVVEVVRPDRDGIPDAKQQRVMSEPAFSSAAPTALAVPAEREMPAAGTRVMSTDSVRAEASLVERAGRDATPSGVTDQDSDRGSLVQTSGVAAHEFHHESGHVEADLKTAPSDAARIIAHIERAVERLHTQEGQRIEMRLPLREGEEIIVKLRLEQGEVKATFRTESAGLKQALEQGWSQFTQNTSERNLRVGPVSFESSSPESGRGGFQQSPDQRDRQTAAGSPEFDLAPAPRPALGGKTPDARRANTASTESLATYA